MSIQLRIRGFGYNQDVKHTIVNPEDVPRGRYASENLYDFAFGAYGETSVLVWSPHLEQALEIAAGWLADHAKGHLIDNKEMARLYEEAKKEDPNGDEESWQETAETDLTYTESGYLPSWEWTVNELQEDDPLYRAAFTASRAGNQLED